MPPLWFAPYRWVSPQWEFIFWQEDAPDVDFESRSRESGATYLALLNTQEHRVAVACQFYNASGDLDHRFGFDMFLDPGNSALYLTDSGTSHFPTPPTGDFVYARGWFELFASSPIYTTAWVHREQHYVERVRAWAYPLPLQDVSFSPLEVLQRSGMQEGGQIKPVGEARGKLFESGAPWLDVTQDAGARRGESPHDPKPR